MDYSKYFFLSLIYNSKPLLFTTDYIICFVLYVLYLHFYLKTYTLISKINHFGFSK